MLHYLLLLLTISLLLDTTSSTVYHVIPDNHYTTNNNTYTLQHYLNNVNKYFTSHTQLHFLPGQYYLNTDLIIQHVSNLSLIGNRTNEVINSVIKCTSPAGIVVVGSSNIVIANIVMEECGNDYKYLIKTYKLYLSKERILINLLLMNSAFITVKYFYSPALHKLCRIQCVNVWGNANFEKITAFSLALWYGREPNNDLFNKTRSVSILHFRPLMISQSIFSVNIQQYNTISDLIITLSEVKFTSRPALYMYHYKCSGHSTLTVANCTFHKRSFQYIEPVVKIRYEIYKGNHASPNKILIMKCNVSIIFAGIIFNIYSDVHRYHSNHTKIIPLLVSIIDCNFHNNDCGNICQINYHNYFSTCTENNLPLLSLINVSFLNNSVPAVIHTRCTTVYIEEVIFSKVFNYLSVITVLSGTITIHKYFEISESRALTAVITSKIILKEAVLLNFTSNNLINIFTSRIEDIFRLVLAASYYTDPSNECIIQYTSNQGNLDKKIEGGHTLNYSIIFQSNNISQLDDDRMAHCGWDYGSAFFSSVPSHVMRKVVNFVDNQIKIPSVVAATRVLCYCFMNKPMCNKDEFGPIFPGENVNFSFIVSRKFYDTIDEHSKLSQPLESHVNFACNSTGSVAQINSKHCTTVPYTISYMYHDRKWCELFILIGEKKDPQGKYSDQVDKYTILLLPCPAGFSLHPQGYCQCDPILSSHIPSLTTCDIDHQTIPRPANTWISAHTINNSHSYHVSLHCPFDYCLPHSSQLNLSTPDSQCQFNRSGVLCRQCQHGLSTVFGSSQCKNCSSVYILLLIPFSVVGILMILWMLAFNMTIAKGSINGFLLYVNILIIDESVILSSQNGIIYFVTYIANLNLGIETCFYNGMDDYAKTWLQLVFPMYLIFIATLLIITSRYSTTIQRLTARRALPVLATLFLLSYTKVLLTVSNVLFSYTSITHLPSKHTTLVWSVDANSSFEVIRFITLFIPFLLLFLILLLYTTILTFPKVSLWFRLFHSHSLKSFLDVHQRAYKKNVHYWTGFHLVIRMVFWGMSFLNENINLTMSIVLLVLVIWLEEKVSPCIRKENNLSVILFLLNLYSIFVVVSTCGKDSIVISILIILAVFQLVGQLLWDIASIRISLIAWKHISFIVSKYHSAKDVLTNFRGVRQQEGLLQYTEPL